MSKELKKLLEEFVKNLEVDEKNKVQQSKELKAIQQSIKRVAEKEWSNLSEEEQRKVERIINDTSAEWYTETA